MEKEREEVNGEEIKEKIAETSKERAEETKEIKEEGKEGIGIKGLHIDPCRHFLSLPTILKLIEYLHQLNFNTLHIHMSDDQGFPFESSKYPQIKFENMLTIRDQEQIAELCQKYNIQIIPELDIPGHCRAFLSIFREGVTIEKKLGIVTTEYIDLDKELPIIFNLFEEYAERFHSKMIHMGGDEAENFAEFPRLLSEIVEFGKKKKLEIIAWDEVGSFLESESPPDNLIIHRWRKGVSQNVSKVRSILSQGYYLDHCDNPIDVYNRNPKTFGDNLGCIACSWTELINENNIYTAILPSLYMLSHRWNQFPYRHPHPVLLLEDLCDKYGYPEIWDRFNEELSGTWKTRLWIGFYEDHPRSTSSVTVDDLLDREHDHYPVFSKTLIKAQSLLFRHSAIKGALVDEQELENALLLLNQATGLDWHFIKTKPNGWKKKLIQLRKGLEYEGKTYKNGAVKILRNLC